MEMVVACYIGPMPRKTSADHGLHLLAPCAMHGAQAFWSTLSYCLTAHRVKQKTTLTLRHLLTGIIP